MKYSIPSEMRFYPDIGMFATDRSVKDSCKWRTKACKECYNDKIYKRFPEAMANKDKKNEIYWKELDGKRLKDELSKKKKFTKRFRLQTRGESFVTYEDIEKVIGFAIENPEIDFWIPTRAWRKPELREYIERYLAPLENVFLNASTDKYTTPEEWISLKETNWSTMFYGIDDMIRTPGTNDLLHLCSKTFFGEKGACATCKDGCFSKTRIDVHLKQH